MARIVVKFGGTSVANVERIRNAVRHIKREVEAGNEVAVVVSAMSGKTNELVGWVNEASKFHDAREYDAVLASGEQVTAGLMAIVLSEMGIQSRSFAGWQVPIHTDDSHGAARITDIDPTELDKRMSDGWVPVITGFQGISPHGRVTTLGRGGSDTSAVAVAAAVKAERCDIYTDVDGVYTADPRVVPDARKLPEISYDELLELASVGTKVMQSRSVEFAKKYGVKFEVRSSLNNNPGTIVTEEHEAMEAVVIRGVSIERSQARVTITGIPDEPGMSGRILGVLGDDEINIDMIVSNIAHDGYARHSFTMHTNDLGRAQAALKPVLSELGGDANLETEAGIAKLSVVGIGMRSHSGVAAQMFKALGEGGINIGMISTSEIKISITVEETRIEDAARVVHAVFGLDSAPA